MKRRGECDLRSVLVRQEECGRRWKFIRVASFRRRPPEASRLDKFKRHFAPTTRGVNVGSGNKELRGDFGIEVACCLHSSCCRSTAHDLLGSIPVIVGRAFRSAYAFPQQLRDGADTVLIHFG